MTAAVYADYREQGKLEEWTNRVREVGRQAEERERTSRRREVVFGLSDQGAGRRSRRPFRARQERGGR